MKYALLAHVRARARICAKATSCNCMFLRIRLFACLPTCYHSIPSHAHNTHTPARSCIRKVQRPPASTHAVQVEQCSWLTANYSNDATSKCIVLFSRMAGNLPVCAPFAGCTTRGLRILAGWQCRIRQQNMNRTQCHHVSCFGYACSNVCACCGAYCAYSCILKATAAGICDAQETKDCTHVRANVFACMQAIERIDEVSRVRNNLAV